MNKSLKYVTYQTFPAKTANSLQTISNIKHLIKNNVNVELYFPLREKQSSDNLEKLHKQDVLISVFDSINYLTDEGAIRVFFKEAYKALRDGGLVIFDFSTPKNSIEAVQHLNELEGDHNGMHYYRTSHFNPHTNIHTNRFEITNKHIQSEEAIVEEHLQRAYTLPNIQSLLLDSELEIVGFFDAFSFEKATTHSTRITAIAKCLKA